MRDTNPPVREPDPTITAHATSPGPFAHAVVIGDRWANPPVAHLPQFATLGATLVPACGTHRGRLSGDWSVWPADHARWITRPCRRCWRGAPRPGFVPDGRRGLDLDWQLPPRARP